MLEMKKTEKVALSSLLLLIASLYLISSGNIRFGTLCLVGFVILRSLFSSNLVWTSALGS